MKEQHCRLAVVEEAVDEMLREEKQQDSRLAAFEETIGEMLREEKGGKRCKPLAVLVCSHFSRNL